MTVPAAAWCVTCGAVPDVALTVERRGALMHYGACWHHVTSVAERARRDVERIDAADRRSALDAQARVAEVADQPDRLDRRVERLAGDVADRLDRLELEP